MAQINLLHAINSALDIAMAEDKSMVCFGEDVGHFGGVFRATVVYKKNMVKHVALIPH